MKILLKLCLVLLCAGQAFAAAPTRVVLIKSQGIVIPAAGYALTFEVTWIGDSDADFSAPGRVELRNSGGNLVGYATATVNRNSGPTLTSTLGNVSTSSWSINDYATDEGPVSGIWTGRWQITGVPSGNYTLRFFEYISETWATFEEPRNRTVWTETAFVEASAAGRPPTISWNAAPSSVGHNQAYSMVAAGHDDDGDLTQVNVWKNGQPFAFTGGGNGTDGSSGNSTTDSGPQTITFSAQAVDATGASSPVITHTVTIAGPPANQPPTVTLLSPGNQTVTAGTTLSITAKATDPEGNLSAHNLDIQRPAGDWNWQGAFATGEPFQGGPVGSGAASTRSATFTFSDIGTYYLRSAANDGSGWYASNTVAITVVSPPPATYSLVTSTASGGTVSPGGSFTAGATATIVAMPDSYHDFAGWSGDAGGLGNPIGILIDRNKAVQATFAWKQFPLTTTATSGGSVTPGGSYPYGSVVTLSASPNASSRFIGWMGAASGNNPSIAVTVNGPLSVQALFAPKDTQAITFNNPGNKSFGVPPFSLAAASTSGLPVTFTVLSGPATYSGGMLNITGPGPITVQASQTGDAFYLPAAAVTQTFNSVAPVVVKFRGAARTVLQARNPEMPANLVLETP